jgi:hypothetical protein
LFLKKLDLTKYYQVFVKEVPNCISQTHHYEQEIDFDILREMDSKELEYLGIPLGPRHKILTNIVPVPKQMG